MLTGLYRVCGCVGVRAHLCESGSQQLRVESILSVVIGFRAYLEMKAKMGGKGGRGAAAALQKAQISLPSLTPRDDPRRSRGSYKGKTARCVLGQTKYKKNLT